MPFLQLNDAIFRDHAQDRALQHQAFFGLVIALRRATLPNRRPVSFLNRGARAVPSLRMTGGRYPLRLGCGRSPRCDLCVSCGEIAFETLRL
jgi:hypothetical protein